MKSKRNRESGFTLLELLVVLSILGLLAAIVGPSVLGYLGSSKSKAAEVQVKQIVASIQLFRVQQGRFPTQDEGLSALVKQPADMPGWSGPYLADAGGIIDPWGRPYKYAMPGKHGEIDVYSLGSDGAEGGSGEAKDVGNW